MKNDNIQKNKDRQLKIQLALIDIFKAKINNSAELKDVMKNIKDVMKSNDFSFILKEINNINNDEKEKKEVSTETNNQLEIDIIK